MIYEPRNSLYVTTPKGKGRVWLVTQFGMETQLLLTVILNDSGEIWEFTNAQITVDPNPTVEGFKSNGKSVLCGESQSVERKTCIDTHSHYPQEGAKPYDDI